MTLTDSLDVEYELKPEDLEAYFLYYYKNVTYPAQKKQRINSWFYIISAAVGGILCLLFNRNTPNNLSLIPSIILFTLAVMVIMGLIINPTRVPTNIKNNIKSRYGTDHEIFLKTHLTINRDAIHIKNGLIESTMSWKVIQNINTDGSYIFMIEPDSQAIIIPKNAFRYTDDFDKFIQTSREFLASAKNPK